MVKDRKPALFTCPNCGAIFPPDNFCAFCGYKIPVKAILDYQMEVAAEEDRLNVLARNFGKSEIRFCDLEKCSSESHYLKAEVNKYFEDIPSENGKMKFCQQCGKKLPEM